MKETKRGSHLVDSYTHKQMGKTLKGKKLGRVLTLSLYEIMTRTASEITERDLILSNLKLWLSHCF